jgi:hypothetical protein
MLISRSRNERTEFGGHSLPGSERQGREVSLAQHPRTLDLGVRPGVRLDRTRGARLRRNDLGGWESSKAALQGEWRQGCQRRGGEWMRDSGTGRRSATECFHCQNQLPFLFPAPLLSFSLSYLELRGRVRGASLCVA